MSRKSERGVNLVELVAVLVVAGIAIPVLLAMWANISWRSVGSENIADAASFARALMENVKSKRFDQSIDSPWTSSANLGVDPGEDSADAATFNDVDDFISSTDAGIITPAPGYIRSVSAAYVYPNATNFWQDCTLPVNCAGMGNCTSCSQCCYKRITVNVRRADGMLDNVNLTTVVAGY